MTRVRHRQAIRPRRGAVLIESALIFLAFFMLLLGIIEFGRAWFSYNLVTHAVREALRLAAVKPALEANDGVVIDRIESILSDGGLTPTDSSVVFNDPLVTGGMIRVTSQVDFAPVVGLWSGGGPIVFPLTVTMVTRYEI
jgi:Flp pilus assembly protein TadG